jgi:hypothetical protein
LVYPCLSHLALAAFWAIRLRSAGVSLAALASPLLLAVSLTWGGLSSSTWCVAIWPILNASSFRSRGRGGVDRFFGMGGI